jgi:hypothetical protein
MGVNWIELVQPHLGGEEDCLFDVLLPVLEDVRPARAGEHEEVVAAL